MPDAGLGRARFVAQGLAAHPFDRPLDVVAALGAMQGQELPGVIASVALRLADGGVPAVLAAMDAGQIVRAYPMRGTVFLTPARDATWISQLCAIPALRAAQRRQHHHGLDDVAVARLRELAVAALDEAGGRLSRGELMAVWERAGQPTARGIGYHVLSRLVAETELFYGPWNGADQDVMLARRWVPHDSGLESRFNGDRVAAVAELLRTYLRGHGPATLRDFAWWTKLPLSQIRAAAPAVVGEFESDGADEAAYWRPGLRDEVARHAESLRAPCLLPGFDEFVLGYQDRTFAMTPDEHQRLVPGNNGVFGRSVVIDGQVRGLWRRGGRKGSRSLELEPFGRLTKAQRLALERTFAEFPFIAP